MQDKALSACLIGLARYQDRRPALVLPPGHDRRRKRRFPTTNLIESYRNRIAPIDAGCMV
jgi:hypothetical protein